MPRPAPPFIKLARQDENQEKEKKDAKKAEKAAKAAEKAAAEKAADNDRRPRYIIFASATARCTKVCRTKPKCSTTDKHPQTQMFNNIEQC